MPVLFDLSMHEGLVIYGAGLSVDCDTASTVVTWSARTSTITSKRLSPSIDVHNICIREVP